MCSFLVQMCQVTYCLLQYGRLGLDWEHVDLRYKDILITLFMNRCLTITFYGAAANRRFLKLMAQRRFSSKSSISIFLRSALCFFFSDPPHLLKTTGNFLASKAKHLWVIIYEVWFCIIYDVCILHSMQWKRHIVSAYN